MIMLSPIFNPNQLNKELYTFLESKYKSIGPIIRRGIYNEKTKQREIMFNL